MADTFKYAQLQPFSLAGAGAIIGATSITLKSFATIDSDGVTGLLQMTDFGTIAFGTLQPGEGTLEEQISFTGVTQNVNGTATLTGVSNVGFLSPYTVTSGLLKTHAGSTSFVISNTSGFYDRLTSKDDDEAITGYWTVPDPISGQGIVPRDYMLNLINGGAISVDSVLIAGVAGETLVTGNLIYLKVADGRWWKTDADTAATVENVQLAIAQGAGTAGNAISGGVLIQGIDTNNTGTGGALAYASNTAGAIGSSAGTTPKIVGQFLLSSAGILFNPNFEYLITNNQKNALSGGGDFGTPSTSNKFVTQDYATATFPPIVNVYSANDTWTKPTGAKVVEVICLGAGGGGGDGRGGAAGTVRAGGTGGGGGAITKSIFQASTLSSTVTITVGTGGTVETAGGDSSFGTYLTAYGGGGGKTGSNASTDGRSGGGGGGSGGVGADGNNANGAQTSIGGVPATTTGTNGIAGQGGGSDSASSVGNAEFGGGAGGSAGTGTAVKDGGSSLFAAAGGGTGGYVASSNTPSGGSEGGAYQSYTNGGGAAAGTGSAGNPGSNGTSRVGFGAGDGGGGGAPHTAGTGGNGGTGGAPGGGGGGGGGGTSTGGTGGTGGVGQVMVITYIY